MNKESQHDRNPDLLLARQFGQLFTRGANCRRIRTDFDRVFPNDALALKEFEAASIEEDQKRLTLGMSPDEYRRYYAKRSEATC